MKSLTIRLIIILPLTIFFGTALVNCQKEQEPEPEPTGTLLLDKLSISIVPEATEKVEIIYTDSINHPQAYSFDCDNPDIAEVTLNGTELLVKGLEYGSANITVYSSNGLQCILPVYVYNHAILETEELFIAFVDTFRSMGSHGSN